MLRLTDPADLPSAERGRGTALTIGMFDGVHRGHARVLAELCRQAATRGLPTLAVTFDPHPLEVLHPERAPQPLASLEQRLTLLESSGVDIVVVQPFTWELAQQSAPEYITGTFVHDLGARIVVVGRDAKFGAGNVGDVGTLRELGQQLGFQAVIVDDVGDADTPRWSSSQIRELLAEGRVARAAQELGKFVCKLRFFSRVGFLKAPVSLVP